MINVDEKTQCGTPHRNGTACMKRPGHTGQCQNVWKGDVPPWCGYCLNEGCDTGCVSRAWEVAVTQAFQQVDQQAAQKGLPSFSERITLGLARDRANSIYNLLSEGPRAAERGG